MDQTVKAIVGIWNGIRPQSAAEFNAWHIREHIPERVAIPGFLRGRRFVALDRRLSFFTLYELASPAAMTSEAYAARLADPTPWTTRVVANFTDTERALCRVHVAVGDKDGGALLTIRLSGLSSEDRLADFITDVGHAIADQHPDVLCVWLFVTDQDASGQKTAESKVRAGDTGIPDAVIALEGIDALELMTVASDRLSDARLSENGADGRITRDLFQHELTIAAGYANPNAHGG